MTDNFRFSFNRFGVGGPNDTVTLLGVKYSNVTTITIPNTYGQTPIANIAEDAFADMPNLIKVDMDVKMLRFYECFRDYPTIYQDLRSQYRAWAKKHKVEPSNLPKYATDYSDLFSNSQQLSHLNIPNEVKNITRAFEGSSISSGFIPKTVEEMEASLKNWHL